MNNIIAHRGIHDNKKVPENSIKAFKFSIKNNCPIELDLQLTKDNKIIVFHDFNLYRLTGKNINVKDLTLHEIKKLSLLDSNEKIPTLKEVLDLVNGKVLLLIEIKNIDKWKEITELTLNVLKDYNGEFLIQSFDPKIIKKIKKLNSKIKCGLLITDKYPNKFYKFIINNLYFKYLKLDFLSISKKLIKNKSIIKYSKNHLIFLWTIKNKKELKKDYCCICNNLPYLN